MRQWCVASTGQLRRRGMSGSAVGRAVASGRLHRVHQGVYSCVPPELLTIEGRRAAAILLGGPGAVLCGATGMHLLRLARGTAPEVIDVAVRGTRLPVDGICWHELTLRPGDRFRYRRMPVTSPGRTLLDAAVDQPLDVLLLGLAEAEYRFGLDAETIARAARQGHPGSAALREAAARHTPALARTRSELERIFVQLLITHGLKIPEINHPVGRSTVDALWIDEGVVAELDGVRGHQGERRILRDHRRDLHRRADGLIPLRYHFTQITREPRLVIADLRTAGIPDVRG